jgi:hypothetical protein
VVDCGAAAEVVGCGAAEVGADADGEVGLGAAGAAGAVVGWTAGTVVGAVAVGVGLHAAISQVEPVRTLPSTNRRRLSVECNRPCLENEVLAIAPSLVERNPKS